MAVKPIPDGYRTLTPYLIVKDVPSLIAFTTGALEGELVTRETRPDGSVMHAVVRIGDSLVMMGEADGDFPAMPASIYLYVVDCDRIYQRAIDAGGTGVFELMNLPSGERYGGVKDCCGNIWWIATHVEDVSPEEQERRWAAFSR